MYTKNPYPVNKIEKKTKFPFYVIKREGIGLWKLKSDYTEISDGAPSERVTKTVF